MANLPPPKTVIPREKPVPVPKPPTKWEQYAKEKGITKQKKSKMVWDDAVKEWIPRFGYKKAKAETEKNWIMEYKEGDDQDPREKAIEEKREKVAKNELQRLRNIARAKKTKVPGVGLTPMVPTESQRSDDLKKASALAKTSTASLGKFQVSYFIILAKLRCLKTKLALSSLSDTFNSMSRGRVNVTILSFVILREHRLLSSQLFSVSR